jgi:hypothetical protein
MTKPEDKRPAETAHDDREIDARNIARFSIGVLVLTAVAMGVMWLADGWLTKSERASHAPPPPMATERPLAPPDPKLQPSPGAGLAQLRAEEEAQLHAYRWIDREEGVVQIPIDRAIELLARRGLPARRQGPATKSPHSEPSESSLGVKEPRR